MFAARFFEARYWDAWYWQATGAESAAVIATKGGIYPEVIRRKKRPQDEEVVEPPPRTVREDIDEAIRRLYGPPEQTPSAATASADAPSTLPQPLSEAERAQVVAALAAIPDNTLIVYGLDQAVEAAVNLMRGLEQEDEEALIIIAASIIATT